jgi:hypothetical protein
MRLFGSVALIFSPDALKQLLQLLRLPTDPKQQGGLPVGLASGGFLVRGGLESLHALVLLLLAIKLLIEGEKRGIY